VFYGGHITDNMDRRCCTTYLQVLIRPEILPQGDLSHPAGCAPPSLELAPGFRAPLPTGFHALHAHIEAALPAESPVVYGMHPNAQLSLLTSLGETLFRTVADVSGGSRGEGGGGCGVLGAGVLGGLVMSAGSGWTRADECCCRWRTKEVLAGRA